MKSASEQDVLRLGRGGLGGDVSKARHRIANSVRAGTVWINCYDVFDAAAPFGGFKMSGIGCELGSAAARNWLEAKTVTMSLD